MPIEPEYEPAYTAWKSNPSPQTRNDFLAAVGPALQKGVTATLGSADPLMLSKGRSLALKALESYDPDRALYNTHLRNQLQSLRRSQQQLQQPIRVPERIALQHSRLYNATQELQAELAREPTDAELSDYVGISLPRLAKLRSYRPAIAEGTLQAAMLASGEGENDLIDPETTSLAKPKRVWEQLVYDELNPTDQLIMEMAMGLNGQPVRSNQEIAARLHRTPGAISQRKKLIQAKLDQEHSISLL